MAFRIATGLVEAILAEAAASPGVEVCGLLLGTRDATPPFALSLSTGGSSAPGEEKAMLRRVQHEREWGGGTITEARPCRNVAADPSRHFEIDPAALIAAYRQARAGGPALLGCYHSHPSGGAEPSARDAANAAPNGWLWLIVAGEKAKGWQAVANGVRFGRFESVDL